MKVKRVIDNHIPNRFPMTVMIMRTGGYKTLQ